MQLISTWNWKLKGLALIFRVLFLGQTNLKSLHKKQIDRERLRQTVYAFVIIQILIHKTMLRTIMQKLKYYNHQFRWMNQIFDKDDCASYEL